jgi:hypothetical protein
MAIWSRLAGFLVVGYLCMTRSFAYLGIAPLFVGEIALGAFLLLKPRVAFGTWAESLLRPSPLNALGLALLAFVSYGVWELGRGVLAGSSLFEALKYFIFNYYPLYLFFGIWVGLQAPDFLQKLVRVVAWVHGIYGLLWVLGLNHMAASLRMWAGMSLIGWPSGANVAILGLLCFERDLRAVWPVLALNVTVTLAMQHRAEWIGLALALLVWGVLTGRVGRVIAVGLAGLAVIGMIELAGIQLPGRTGSGVSLTATLGRAIVPFDPKLAEAVAPDAKKHVGSADWRREWWNAIWDSVHSTPMLAAFGHGYGFYLLGLMPAEDRGSSETLDTRTPHSVFYYALGYTGWVGVGLFCALQLAILRLAWQAFRVSGQPAGLIFWIAGMTAAFFEQSFDTPYKAIPFYLLVGMGMAPALQAQGGRNARAARAQLLSVARR